MFQVQLTAYGQSLVSDLINIDGIMLLYDYIADLSSVTSASSYTVTLDEEACGNLKNKIGNVFIRDLSTSEYQAKTILFYKLDGSQKKIVAGYSQEQPLVQKSTSILSIYLTFDFSVFTHGFLFASIQAGYSTAAHNTDGLLHLEDPNIESDDTYSVYSKPQVDTLLQSKQESLEAGNGISLEDNVVKTTGIPFGICDNTSTSTAFTVTVPGIYKLEDGVCCLVKNGVITSASGFTLNVNGLGGKPCYSNMAAATRETTIFNVNYTLLFVYDSTRIDSGCWICYRGYYSDANSIAYQIRGNVHTLPTTAKFYRYRLLFTSADGTHFVPSNTSTSTNATALRDVNQTPIDPFGEIVYYSTTAVVEANANPGPAYLWTQYAITFGYSFNRSGAALTLTSFAPVYIKCAPQSDGSAIIDATTPYVQTLPSTADDKIYIFLGIANSATSVELLNNHPVYYHDGTAIRIWHGKDSYSKDEIDSIVSGYVQSSLTINDKPLTSDITLTLDDIVDGTNRVLPTNVSQLNNDAGYITGYTETDPTVPAWAKESTKPSYTASEVGALPDTTVIPDSTSDLTNDSGFITSEDIPTNVSAFTNDAGYLTAFTETDPTVPDWAKQSTKPSYTAAEVGALPDDTFIPSKTSDLTNDSGFITSASIPTNVSAFTNDAGYITSSALSPYELKTNLKEGAYIDVDETTMTSTSSNLPTSKAVASYISGLNYITSASIPTNVSAFTNDAGYLTSHQSLAGVVASAQYNSTLKKIEFYNPSGTKLSTDIDASAFIKDGMVDTVEVTGGNLVITFNTDAGKEDIEIPISDIFDASNYYTKTETNTQISSAISDLNLGTASTKNYSIDMNTDANLPTTAAIKSYITNQNFATVLQIPTTTSQLTNNSGFITSADIPTNVSAFTNDSGYITSAALSPYELAINLKEGAYVDVDETTMTSTSDNLPTGKAVSSYISSQNFATVSQIPTTVAELTDSSNYATYNSLSEVATSGDYDDLTNKPSIPDSTSDLTNDSGFITSAAIPTNISAFTNDSGYMKASDARNTFVAKITATDKAITRFKSTDGSVQNSKDILNDDGTIILPAGNTSDQAANCAHIEMGYGWIGAESSRETSVVIGNIVSRVPSPKYYFTDHIFRPASDNTFYLGNAVFRWKYLYLSDSIRKSNSYTLSLPDKTGTIAVVSDIPTAVSALTNDAGYITSASIPTNVSAFTNDAGYITSADIPSDISEFNNDANYITSADIPTNVSAFTNDAGYLTSYTETDPTVPSWAKASTKPSYTLDEVTDGTTRKLSDYVRLATTNRENQTINSSITIHPKHNSYNNYREYTFNGTDFSSQTSMELVSWDFESNETVTKSIKLSLQPAIYSEENLEPAYYFRLYIVDSTYSNYEEIFFITKEFDSNSSYYNVNGTAVANYSSVPNTSLVDGRLTTVDYVNAKVKEVYCNATTEVDRDLVPSNYDYRENAPQGTHPDNPKYNGNDVSLGVNQYLEFSDNMRVSVYVLNETYVGSIAFLTAEDASTYAAYPVYFRGQGSAHNASVPAGSVLRLTFKQNSFNVDFYDLADFGVEHEPIVRVGQVPHHKTLNSYNGALVGIRKDNRKFDHAITVTKSATSSSNTLLNMEPNSPIYVSFMGECFAAHPRVPFGFVTNMEYIYSAGASLTLNNIPFVYVEGGLQVTDLDELQSHIVENTVGGQRYFHVDDAPVYILLSDEYDPLYISIGGLPIDSDGHLIGYLCHGAEHAGLIRLVQNNLPTRASLSARILTTYSGTAKLVAESSYISARDDIYPNVNSTSSSNGYTLGSSSYKWRYIYLSSGISNGTYTYSLPSATGTLALTSDLPTNYVTTDTAQTISGNKTFTGTLTGTLTGNADSATDATNLVYNNVTRLSASADGTTSYFNIVPSGTAYLGTTTSPWQGINVTQINLGSYQDSNNTQINANFHVLSTSTVADQRGIDVTGNLNPVSSSAYNLGNSAYRWKNLYTDNIYIGSEGVSLSNYIINTTVTNATNATNTTYVNVSTSSTSASYPLVFTSNVTAGNKTLYTDTANTLYYNPSSNILYTSDVLPRTNSTSTSTGFSLGGTSNKWRYLYANYLGSSSTHITSAYINTIYLGSNGNTIETTIANTISSGTTVGSVRLFTVNVSASTTSMKYITQGTTFDSAGITDSGGTTRSISFAYFASSYIQSGSTSFIRCVTYSATISGTWKVLVGSYLYNSNNSHGVDVPILAVRIS